MSAREKSSPLNSKLPDPPPKNGADPLPPPMTEEEMALEPYSKENRRKIQELTKEVGYPQASVIVALEITNFSKRYAMEWLLSEEFQLHKKHDTQRGALKQQKSSPKGERTPRLLKVHEERKEEDRPKASAHKKWSC